jgi:hypothetical protein
MRILFFILSYLPIINSIIKEETQKEAQLTDIKPAAMPVTFSSL